MQLNEAIERIRQMESIFDALEAAVSDGSFRNEGDQAEMLCILRDYYENGQWLADYESDERGELPADLKRGVLSQDGVYNLLENISILK